MIRQISKKRIDRIVTWMFGNKDTRLQDNCMLFGKVVNHLGDSRFVPEYVVPFDDDGAHSIINIENGHIATRFVS